MVYFLLHSVKNLLYQISNAIDSYFVLNVTNKEVNVTFKTVYLSIALLCHHIFVYISVK